jgi:polar amino acid transport system substrate-binding protein
MYKNIIAELAPTGTLRAGINMANIFLVTGTMPNGDPDGVSPNIAKAIADKLGVDVTYIPNATPGGTADMISKQVCDIVLIADEPARAKFIEFTEAYVEIEATYIVPEASSFKTIEDVDQSGARIAVSGTSAYDLYLTRTLKKAQLIRAEGLPAAVHLFASKNLEALAGLRPALNENLTELKNCRIIKGRYMAVQQAIGTRKDNLAAIEFLQQFITQAKDSGLILDLINRHGVNEKLQVAI